MDSERFYTVLDKIDFDFEKHLTIRSMLYDGLFHDRNSDEPCEEITNGPHVPYQDYSFETVRGKLCEQCFGTMTCIYRKDGKTQALSTYDVKEDFSQYALLYQNFYKLLSKVKDIPTLATAYSELYDFQTRETSYIYNGSIPEGHFKGEYFTRGKVLFIEEASQKAQKDFLKVEKQILTNETTSFESFLKDSIYKNFLSPKKFFKTKKAEQVAKDTHFQKISESEDKALLFFRNSVRIFNPRTTNFGIWLNHYLISEYKTYFDVKSKSYLFEVPLIIKELLGSLPPDLLDNSIPFVLPTETNFTQELFENFTGLQDINSVNTVDDFKEAVFVAVNI